jgi:hypothetical protein
VQAWQKPDREGGLGTEPLLTRGLLLVHPCGAWPFAPLKS